MGYEDDMDVGPTRPEVKRLIDGQGPNGTGETGNLTAGLPYYNHVPDDERRLPFIGPDFQVVDPSTEEGAALAEQIFAKLGSPTDGVGGPSFD